jgi:hypothetical protein
MEALSTESVQLSETERNMLVYALVQEMAGRNCFTVSASSRGKGGKVADRLVEKKQFARVTMLRTHKSGSNHSSLTYKLTDAGRIRATRVALRRLDDAPS